jgi:hypothetical protein
MLTCHQVSKHFFDKTKVGKGNQISKFSFGFSVPPPIDYCVEMDHLYFVINLIRTEIFIR